MGKKRAASSAAAASLLPEHLRGSTFTSLSEITRKVLEENPAEELDADPWTTEALAIAKRMMKRDEVTRAKAVAELRNHVEARNDAPSSTEILTTFERIFRRTITEDSSAMVRRDCLHVMKRLVVLYKNSATGVLKSIVPPWLGARGDESKTVADAARLTFQEAFPRGKTRSKVLNFTAEAIRNYATSEANTNTDINISRALATVEAFVVEIQGSSNEARQLHCDPESGLARGGSLTATVDFAVDALKDPAGGNEAWELLLSALGKGPTTTSDVWDKVLPVVVAAIKRSADAKDTSIAALSAHAMLPLLALAAKNTAGQRIQIFIESVLQTLQDVCLTEFREVGRLFFSAYLDVCVYLTQVAKCSPEMRTSLVDRISDITSSFVQLRAGADGADSATAAASAIQGLQQEDRDKTVKKILETLGTQLRQSADAKAMATIEAVCSRFQLTVDSLMSKSQEFGADLAASTCITLESIWKPLLEATEESERTVDHLLNFMSSALADTIPNFDRSKLKSASSTVTAFLTRGVHVNEAAKLACLLFTEAELAEVGRDSPFKSISALLSKKQLEGEWINESVRKAVDHGEWRFLGDVLSSQVVLNADVQEEVFDAIIKDMESQAAVACIALTRLSRIDEQSTKRLFSAALLHKSENDNVMSSLSGAWQNFVKRVPEVDLDSELCSFIGSKILERRAFSAGVGQQVAEFASLILQKDEEVASEFVVQVVRSNLDSAADDFLASFVMSLGTVLNEITAAVTTAGLHGSEKTRTAVLANLTPGSATEGHLMNICVLATTESRGELGNLRAMLATAFRSASGAVVKATADAAKEKGGSVLALVASEIRNSSLEKGTVESALLDIEEQCTAAIGSMRKRHANKTEALEVLTTIQALYPAEIDISSRSAKQLVTLANEVRLWHQASAHEQEDNSKESALFDSKLLRSVLAPAVRHAAEDLNAVDVRFSVSMALNFLRRGSPLVNSGAVVLSAELLRSSVLSETDRQELGQASRRRFPKMLSLFDERNVTITRAVAWIAEHMLNETDLKSIPTQEIFKYLRSGPSEAQASMYRLLLRAGQPTVSGYVESIIDEDKAAISRFPKSFADALIYKEGEDSGYFLCWSLLLDFLCTTEEAQDAGDGDRSFRRAALDYLRAKQNIDDEFFSRSVSSALSLPQVRCLDVPLEPSTDEDFQAMKDLILAENKAAIAFRAFALGLRRLPALSRKWFHDVLERQASLEVEAFTKKRISPRIIEKELTVLRDENFEATTSSEIDAELSVKVSLTAREATAKYLFSDVTLNIVMKVPDTFPLRAIEVSGTGKIGEAKWRRTLLDIIKLLSMKDGTMAEAIELWRRNLDKVFEGVEECPICFAVLHFYTGAVPKMTCRTCKKKFHASCLCKWFNTANSSACPMCRSAF